MFKKMLVVLMILGFVLTAIGFVMTGGDFDKIANAFINDSDYSLVEKKGSEEFEELKINLKSANLAIFIHDEEDYKLNFYESEYDTKSVKVENKQLKIEQEYKSIVKWFNFKFISKKIQTINLYIPNTFNGKVDIKTDSGNVVLNALQFESLNIIVSSGNIILDNGIVSTHINLEASSGNIKLNKIKAGNLMVKTSSGNIRISNSNIESNSDLKISSGNIEVIDTKSNEIIARASSGNINLTRVKIIGINTQASSGNISIIIIDDAENYKIEANVNSGSVYL